MNIPSGIYQYKTETGINISSETLTVQPDFAFVYVTSESYLGPNSSETYSGKILEEDGKLFLMADTLTSFSYSPVDEFPEENTAAVQARWKIEVINDSTLILHKGKLLFQLSKAL